MYMPTRIESINGFLNNNLMIFSILSKKDGSDLENDKNKIVKVINTRVSENKISAKGIVA